MGFVFRRQSYPPPASPHLTGVRRAAEQSQLSLQPVRIDLPLHLVTAMTNAPTVSEIVRHDYRTADVFRKWGINYCCGGNRPLEEVCRLQGIDRDAVEADLAGTRRSRRLLPGIDPATWPLPFLIDYIQQLHHAFLRNSGWALGRQLHDFVAGHEKKYPYLREVDFAFTDLLEQCIEQVEAEEEGLFPYLRQLWNAHTNHEEYGALYLRTLIRPKPHAEGERRVLPLLERLRALTANYTFGEGACTNHQVLYHKLRDFDEDLVQHLYLEQSVLQPRAALLEKELRAL
ncbi:MAG: hypothetical protein EOO12_03120 [Chitinophagaceae bacterium]|nr:MAG: hypothetical protein EOO12_03120 [Chitinophagaceae bacterium]